MKLNARFRTIILGACTFLLLGAGATVQAADASPTTAPATAPAASAPGASAGPLKLAQAGPHNATPVWRDVRQGSAGITTIKGVESGVLIQTEGNAWRQWRNGPVTILGGLMLLGVVGSILLFHAWKGMLRLSSKPTGRKIQRFTTSERLIHNVVAGSFVLLGIGGVLMLFGKHIAVPFLGHTVFAFLMQILKPVHNFIGLVFFVALLAMILMWAKDNVWDNIDAEWIRRAGGLIDRSHVPSGRFNFGEKTWFWFGVTILGLAVSVSGILLDFPSVLELRSNLVVANLIHAIGALLMIMLALGHIYMGTIGVEGAMQSMKTGQVDEAWAQEHHEAWFNQVTAKNKRA
jgi:formate dehydrogenase subunit gamma